jgi:hypothetical protein
MNLGTGKCEFTADDTTLWELGQQEQHVAFELAFYRPFGQASPLTTETRKGDSNDWLFKPQQVYITADFEQSQLKLLTAPGTPGHKYSQDSACSEGESDQNVGGGSAEESGDPPLWQMFFSSSEASEDGEKVGGERGSVNGIKNGNSGAVAAESSTISAASEAVPAASSVAAAVASEDGGVHVASASVPDSEKSGAGDALPKAAGDFSLSSMFSLTPTSNTPIQKSASDSSGKVEDDESYVYRCSPSLCVVCH